MIENKLAKEGVEIAMKIREFDPFVANVLTEYCQQLSFKDSRRLKISESVLLKSIELKCSDESMIVERELQGVIRSAKRILEGSAESDWTHDHKELFHLLKKIVFVGLGDENEVSDADQIDEVVDALMRLDYSKEMPVFQVINEERNIYNYIGLILESIGQKFKESTVSVKAINTYLSIDQTKIFAVVDSSGNIRFMSRLGEKILQKPLTELIDCHISAFVPEWQEQDFTEALNHDSQEKTYVFGREDGTKKECFIAVSKATFDEFTGEEDEISEYIVSIDLDTSTVENDEEVYNNLTAIDSVIEAIKSLKHGKIEVSEHNYRLQNSLESLYKMKYHQLDKLNDVDTSHEEFFDPTTMVKSILSELRFHDGFDQISFSIQNKKHTPFYGDSETIYSVLKHLISNAVKYRNPAVNSSVEICFSENANKSMIEVIDNGIGISEEQIAHIFKRGFRGQTSIEGYGLGLFFMRRCLLRCNGSCQVESTLGVGSKFTVYLPI